MDILSFTLFITLKRKYKTYSLFTEYHISSKVAWFEPVQGCRSILYRNTLSNLVFDEQTRFTQQNEMDMKCGQLWIVGYDYTTNISFINVYSHEIILI